MGIEEEEYTQENVDEMVNQAYAPEPPMAETAPQETTEPTTGPVGLHDWKFTANGKEVIPETPEKLKQWASMGYNYGQRMREFNDKYSLYEQIDKHAQENPDWWNHVQSQYDNRGSLQGTPQPEQQTPNQGQSQASPEIDTIRDELGTVKEFMKDWQTKQWEEKKAQEDQALDQEITKVRESYNDFNWNDMDEHGLKLEDRVVKHAQAIGTNNFTAAFRDLMHDQLVKRATLKGQEEAGKNIQRNKKAGLLGETPEPLRKFQETPDTKKMSYDELEAFELKQLGLT
jgi:hypothetical protein